VYAITYLGYGANVARDRYLERLIGQQELWKLVSGMLIARKRQGVWFQVTVLCVTRIMQPRFALFFGLAMHAIFAPRRAVF
jgi:hypothetical protein